MTNQYEEPFAHFDLRISFVLHQQGALDICRNNRVVLVGRLLGALPERIQHGVLGSTAAGRAGYAFSVYLFAPVAVIVHASGRGRRGENSER